MLLCTELAPTKAAIEAKLLAAKPIQQRKRIPTANSTTSKPRNTGKGKAPAKKRTYSKSNKPSKVEMDRRKAEGAVSTVAKVGTWQISAQRKKL